jgi:hypothetical protein
MLPTMNGGSRTLQLTMGWQVEGTDVTGHENILEVKYDKAQRSQCPLWTAPTVHDLHGPCVMAVRMWVGNPARSLCLAGAGNCQSH